MVEFITRRVAAGIAGMAMALAGLVGATEARADTQTAVYGDWEVSWNDSEATVRHWPSGRAAPLYRNIEPTVAEGEEGYSTETHRMLSVVGPIVSWSASWYAEGGAHPSYGQLTATADLSKLDPAKFGGAEFMFPSASLIDRFDNGAVFRQLMAHPTVRQAVTAAIGTKPVGNIGELIEAADGGCEMAMNGHLLTDFHFAWRLGGKYVAVVIGLSHGCEVARGTFTELAPIFLPIPKSLAAAFDDAVEQGLLEDRAFEKPGFDCAKASAPIEVLMCGNAELAGLDRAVGDLYGGLRKNMAAAESKALRNEQRKWLAARDAACAPLDAPCLTEQYRRRLAVLQAM